MASMTDLPTELHLIIASHLDDLSQMSLKITNRHFYSLISPLTSDRMAHAQIQLHRRRSYAYLACMTCLRLRPNLEFTDEWPSGVIRTPHLWHTYIRTTITHYFHDDWCLLKQQFPDLQCFECDESLGSGVKVAPRICIECGIKNGGPGYQAGSLLWVRGLLYIIKTKSPQLEPPTVHCSRHSGPGASHFCWISKCKYASINGGETWDSLGV